MQAHAARRHSRSQWKWETITKSTVKRVWYDRSLPKGRCAEGELG